MATCPVRFSTPATDGPQTLLPGPGLMETLKADNGMRHPFVPGCRTAATEALRAGLWRACVAAALRHGAQALVACSECGRELWPRAPPASRDC
jgi:hypothetical protein